MIDTGASIAGPGGAELPVFVSPIVDARYGPTAALGIPAVDEADATIAARLDRVEARRAAARARAGAGAGRERPRGEPLPRLRLLDLPPALLGDADPGRPLRGVRAGAGARARTCRSSCPATSSRPAKGTRWPSAPTSSTSSARSCGGPPSARPTPSTATSTRSGSGSRPRCRPRPAPSRCSPTRTCGEWLPSERLVAGNDSGGFVFDQRVVTKALRDIGPFAFIEEGEPFAGCLFHEMVIADGRKMSKHLGNVVNPDELVAEHGADTVRLAVLYAAGPAKTLNWNDGAMRFAEPLPAQPLELHPRPLRRRRRALAHDPEAAADTEHSCATACANGATTASTRITEDLERAADAQGGPQHHPPLRADPGLREAGDQAPRAARAAPTPRRSSPRWSCWRGRWRRSRRMSPRSCCSPPGSRTAPRRWSAGRRRPRSRSPRRRRLPHKGPNKGEFCSIEQTPLIDGCSSVMNGSAGRSTGEGGGALGYGKPPWGGKGGPILSQDLTSS